MRHSEQEFRDLLAKWQNDPDYITAERQLLLDVIDELTEQRDALLAALEEILASGIEHDDPRNRYKLIQVYHGDWEAAKVAVKRAKGGA